MSLENENKKNSGGMAFIGIVGMIITLIIIVLSYYLNNNLPVKDIFSIFV